MGRILNVNSRFLRSTLSKNFLYPSNRSTFDHNQLLVSVEISQRGYLQSIVLSCHVQIGNRLQAR
jgi:hypothetical protein